MLIRIIKHFPFSHHCKYSIYGTIQLQKQCLNIQLLVLINHFQSSTNSLCDLASIIFKNIYFENEGFKYHQKDVLLLGPSSLLHILICLWQGKKKEFFKTVSLNYSCAHNTLMTILFCIWTQGSQKLSGILNCINSLHPTIKLEI